MRRPGLSHLAVAFAATALIVAVPIATASAAATPAATSATVPVLSLNAPVTPPALPGDILTATLTAPPLTLLEVSSGLGLTCNASTWQGQLLSNPAVPGPAVIKLLAYTISACSDTNPGVTVLSVTVSGLPDTLTVNGATFALQIVPASSVPLTITAVVNAGSVGTVSCVYQAAPPTNGITALGITPWKFANQPFNLVAGPLGPCGATPADRFTAVYFPVMDGTKAVYVN
jgi:hypothetical protein